MVCWWWYYEVGKNVSGYMLCWLVLLKIMVVLGGCCFMYGGLF